MKVLATNKKAKFNYFLEDDYICGIVLKGTEIKSVRANKINIADAYCIIRNEEMYVVNLHISRYDHGNTFNHDETRSRKLLLHKKEIRKIQKRVNQEKMTIVPTKIMMDRGLCKVEIALGKGKKNYDKRQSLKEKDAKRRIQKSMKENYR